MNKFSWLIPIILIGLITILRRIERIPEEVSNDILTILVLTLSISIVIAILRFLPQLER